ncbi:hypothetical protein EVAR_87879_1 [Eumeta japonica]|uniref:Uncharacterized protein n=1 Tax=Eumeta variegata TaxID=151549 RepID=A0A4C1WTI0_EUMVA|nr:hypothetical protein EVAR_87879_1 [Eumeta japonica]
MRAISRISSLSRSLSWKGLRTGGALGRLKSGPRRLISKPRVLTGTGTDRNSPTEEVPLVLFPRVGIFWMLLTAGDFLVGLTLSGGLGISTVMSDRPHTLENFLHISLAESDLFKTGSSRLSGLLSLPCSLCTEQIGNP